MMPRFLAAPAIALMAGGLLAAPPAAPPSDVKALVARLSDPDPQARRAAAEALTGRADALPWLRRANRSDDDRTARRADALIAPHRVARQAAVPKALDACIRDGRIDLFTEWHQWWEPRAEQELWDVGPRIAKAGLDLYTKSCPKDDWATLEKWRARTAALPATAHNGPCPTYFPRANAAWTIRTDRMDQVARANDPVLFASVGGPVRSSDFGRGGTLLALGSLQTGELHNGFVACDGDVWQQTVKDEMPLPGIIRVVRSVVVCRGDFVHGGDMFSSVVLADGDIDLTMTNRMYNCLIRAGGEVHLRKDVKIHNSSIEGRAAKPGGPYTFFELADVGLSVADDEEGLVVRAVQPGTPFGSCGLAEGDLIRAIDDTRAGHAEPFRKAVRRAVVRQGDCLLTVARGGTNLDLPVFFPLPK